MMDTTENKDAIQNVFGHTELNKYEIEELNLYKHSNCNKNPGHKQFISADRFTFLDLPESYREQKYFDFIKVISDLTVRIAITEISKDRPDYVPDTTIPYTCSEDRGRKVQYTGSGKITHVFKLENPKQCLCSECTLKNLDKNVRGEIWISTAAHVVFDQLEAQNTSCRLFFDRENCDKVIIQGVGVIDVNVRRDYCTLICETCDEDLMNKLASKLETCKVLDRIIYKTVEKPLPSEKMFVIISHPHGTLKHITIGQKSAKDEEENIFSKQFYNTPTCSGSSGAPVLVFGYIGWYSGIVHSGTRWTLSSDEEVPNYSTLGFEFLFLPSLTDSACNMILKEHALEATKGEDSKEITTLENRKEFKAKDNITGRSERHDPPINQTMVTLQNSHLDCYKNPGHRDFIPVNSFTLDHLPEDYQNLNLYELIKILSELTVKLLVKGDRPEFRPSIKFFVTSTGFIYDIIKYTDGYKCCDCNQCQISGAPSKVWFEIIVFTAAHVVVDNIQAKYTTAKLFYDGDYSEIINLQDKARTIKVFIEDDVCVLGFTTCNEFLSKKLNLAIGRVNALKSDIFQKYAQTDLDNLIVVISHPHGRIKHVSMGQLKHVASIGKLRQRYKHTASTCPGSSGALVYNIKSRQISLHSRVSEDRQVSNTCFSE